MASRAKAILKLIGQRAKLVGLAALDVFCLLPLYMMSPVGDRAMTRGEKEDIADIFGKAVDGGQVRIHSSPGMDVVMGMPNSLKGERVVVNGFTLGSKVFMGMPSASQDYSAAAGKSWTPAHENRATFIHENVHVWHAQNCPVQAAAIGLVNYFGALVRPRNEIYKYKLEEGKDLLDFGHEKQASIIKDFYGRVREGYMPEDILNDTSDRAKMVNLYKGVLKNFAADPAYISKNCNKLWKTL